MAGNTRKKSLAVTRVVELIVIVCVIGTGILAAFQLLNGSDVAAGREAQSEVVGSIGMGTSDCRKQERFCVMQCDAGDSRSKRRQESQCFERCIADSGCPVYL